MKTIKGLVLAVGILLFLIANISAATIEVSEPIQATSDTYYERGQSIVYDGSDYWLFYGRSTSVTGNYGNSNPDTHDYEIYYRKAATIAGLASATPVKVSCAHNSNVYLGETSAAYVHGQIYVYGAIDRDGVYNGGNNGNDLYQFRVTDITCQEWNLTSVMVVDGRLTNVLPEGSAHHAATESNGFLWVAYHEGDGWKARSWSPATSWSAEYTITGGSGTAKFFVDGSNLYFVRAQNGNITLHIYNSTSNSWDLVDFNNGPSANGAYDPTIFKDGSNYVLAYAPWDGTKQYIKAKVSTSIDNLVSGGADVMITAGSYKSNPWVDMWPIGFTDDGGSNYLFYTSERNPDNPFSEITGNIWYLDVDWDVNNNHFTYIQNAIDDASDGDTVVAKDGVYNENLVINKEITLTAGSSPVIDCGGSGVGIDVASSNVEINSMTIRNCEQGILTWLNSTEYGASPGYSNLRYLSNKIYNISKPSPNEAWGFGIYIGTESERYNPSHGLYDPSLTSLLDFTGLQVTGNEIYNTSGASIVLQSMESSSSKLQVYENRIHDNSMSCIWIDSANDIEVKSNELTNCSHGVFISSYSDGYYEGTPNATYDSKDIDIVCNDIDSNRNNGISVYDGWPTTFLIQNNNIVNNNNYGAYNFLSTDIIAEYNYWGDNTGPYHASMNLLGQGNAVSDNVDFKPWLYSPVIVCGEIEPVPVLSIFGLVALAGLLGLVAILSRR